MSRWRHTGVMGLTVAVSGGLIYVLWKNYVRSRKQAQQQDGEAAAGSQGSEGGIPLFSEAKYTNRQVLVLGLDGAGKTSLLHCLATNNLEQEIYPTKGFNAVSISKEEIQIEFLEIGGTEHLRPYWKKYVSNAQVLVYVVDSTDVQRFPLAKKHLHDVLASSPNLSLVVFANKQDKAGALSITDLHEALNLSEAGDDRKLFLIGTHVKKGETTEIAHSVHEARELILQLVSEGR